MKTILIVDDLELFRDTLSMALKSRGFKVYCASNGIEGLELAEINKPSLMLLDIGMPEMDGIEVLRRMKANPALKDIPVFLLTALSQKDKVIEAATLGVRDYLLKSQFSLDTLISRIEKKFHAIQTGAATGASEKTSGRNKPAATSAQNKSLPKVTCADLPVLLERSNVEKLLESSELLKAFPPTVSQILAAARNSRASVDDVARAIRQDQAVCLKLLRMANSCLYRRGEQAETIQKAVGRIGLGQIQQIVLAIGVIDIFNSNVENDSISPPLFWEHSLACAIMSADILRALECPQEQIDSVFTAGLLHDVGRMTYRSAFSNEYAQVVSAARQNHLPLEDVENRMLGASHSEIMIPVLRDWHMPQSLIDPVCGHHHGIDRIRRLADEAKNAAAAVAIADRVAHAMVIGSSGNTSVCEIEPLAELIGIKRQTLLKIAHDAPDKANEMKYLMLSRSDDIDWPDYLEHMRESLREPVNLLPVGIPTPNLAIEMICGRLSTAGDQLPRAAVLEAPKDFDIQTVDDLMATPEKQASVSNLPVILFCPQCPILNMQQIKNRTVITIPARSSTETLIQAINAVLTAAQSAKAA